MQAPTQRPACALHTVSLQHSPAARGHARTRQAAAGRVPAAGSGRAAACRQAWTHAGWRTPQRPPQGARSGARRGAGLSQRHRALAGIWPCEFPFPQLGSRNFGLGSISRTVEPCSTRVFDGLPAQTIWIKFHPETSEIVGTRTPSMKRRVFTFLFCFLCFSHVAFSWRGGRLGYKREPIEETQWRG